MMMYDEWQRIQAKFYVDALLKGAQVKFVSRISNSSFMFVMSDKHLMGIVKWP